jgi:hypothetical protein
MVKSGFNGKLFLYYPLEILKTKVHYLWFKIEKRSF